MKDLKNNIMNSGNKNVINKRLNNISNYNDFNNNFNNNLNNNFNNNFNNNLIIILIII